MINRKTLIMDILIVALIMIAISAISSLAQAQLLADYNRTIDGDTVSLDIWLTDSLILRRNVRLANIDTPEIRGRCEQEKAKAIDARDFVDQELSQANTIIVFPVRWADKYGRPVVRVSLDGWDLTEQLLHAGLGRPYDGGKRGGWCDDPPQATWFFLDRPP